MAAPDPMQLYPPIYGPNAGRTDGQPVVVFLKPLVQSPLTEVGEYTYYADPVDPTGFERHNVLFHYGPNRLIIGKYCALARNVRFLMGSANHLTASISTFPFPMFGDDWLPQMSTFAARPDRGDTVVGNDVWIGYQSLVMPGVRIGDGAIVAAGSVVVSDVPPYTVVGGNPARHIRERFPGADVARLLALAWWDWPVQRVTRSLPALMAGDVDALEAAARDGDLARSAAGATPEYRSVS